MPATRPRRTAAGGSRPWSAWPVRWGSPWSCCATHPRISPPAWTGSPRAAMPLSPAISGSSWSGSTPSACDAVTDGDLGAQLFRSTPTGLDPGRPCDPVYAARRDPREPPAVRLILDGLTAGHGLVTVPVDARWRSAPARYREHGLFVAANDSQAREQLASGARVVGPVGAGVPAPGAAPGPDAARAAREIEAGWKAGARGPAEIRPVLRDLFESHATPARLAGMARLLGLPTGVTPSRRIAILAEFAGASPAQRLRRG